MTLRDDGVSLRHMLDHAAEAVEIARGRSRTDLDLDRVLALALTKLIEIVGEAANRVSSVTRDAHPGIPWREIIGTRHRLVHGYDEVDFDVLWRIVSAELPPLIQQIETLLSDRSESGS